MLRPISPPRVLDDVYPGDEYERMLGVIKRDGPWPTITAHHFDTVEELVATTSGPMREGDGNRPHPRRHRDRALPRLLRAELGVVPPGARRLLLQPEVSRPGSGLLGCEYAKPTLMLFNLCGPHHSGLSAHLDAVTFRGVRIENSPVWLQNVMGKSGLFTEHLVKMAQVITWWYLGRERHVHVLARRAARRAAAPRPSAVEQGRRRAERVDVPSRRSGRPARRT